MDIDKIDIITRNNVNLRGSQIFKNGVEYISETVEILVIIAKNFHYSFPIEEPLYLYNFHVYSIGIRLDALKQKATSLLIFGLVQTMMFVLQF